MYSIIILSLTHVQLCTNNALFALDHLCLQNERTKLGNF